MQKSIKYGILTAVALLISACAEPEPTGPDLSGIETRDHNYFNEIVVVNIMTKDKWN